MKPYPLANGINGIYISKGAHDIRIGESDPYLSVGASGHQNGAGLLIEGPETKNIFVGNSVWGHPPTVQPITAPGSPYGNLYGIHIKDGAKNVVIGTRGQPRPEDFRERYDNIYSSGPRFPSHLVIFHTAVLGNVGAGIFIDSAGGTVPGGTTTHGAPPATPVEGNVIQNVRFGRTYAYNDFGKKVYDWEHGNNIGLLISGDTSYGNRIGGSEAGEGNIFSSSEKAAIKIEYSTVNPAFANRIIGNVIETSAMPEVDPADPLGVVPDGMGVFVSTASGHVIGGRGPGESNTIRRNMIGVQVRDSSNIAVVNNQIGTDTIDGALEDEGGNELAGVIFAESEDCVVGPKNRIILNGLDPTGNGLTELGGIYIQGGQGNKVVGNWIGTNAAELYLLGNSPNGVHISDSPGNVIGDAGANGINRIVDSAENGILIEGALSYANQVSNNRIGVGSIMSGLTASNGGSGVFVRDGATLNIIGGHRPVMVQGTSHLVTAGNTIKGNVDAGVRINGATTTGNTITYNSISQHGSRGIAHGFGGNNDLPPPTITDKNNERVWGTVAASVPDGSLVQIFTDNGDEGEVFQHEGKVLNGKFDIYTGNRVLPNLTATVTRVTTNDPEDTSEFSGTMLINVGLDIRRTSNPVGEGDAATGYQTSAVALTLTTGGASVLVEKIIVGDSGTADETSALTGLYLYEDRDEDAKLSGDDTLIAGPVTFAEHVTEFDDLEVVLNAYSTNHWLLVAEVKENAAVGGTLIFTIESESKVFSRCIFPQTSIIETGSFPLESDTLTIYRESAISTEIIQEGSQGVDYALSFLGVSGSPPYTWSISDGCIPDGLSMDSVKGILSGIPAQCGNFGFTVRMEDSSVVTNIITKTFQLGILCVTGDVNGDMIIDLADAILATQVAVGILDLSNVNLEADINGDGKIGMQEAIYVLQTIVRNICGL